MRNKDEHHYWSDMKLQDVGRDLDTDEEISSGENIKGQFNKLELMNNFHKVINDVITHMISEIVEEPLGS